MSYNVEILADSIANEQRITTVELTFPRFILAEVNTHRMFSRNSASSRAIPTEKIIERVANEPFVPETFNKRVKGMGVGEEFDEQAAEIARSWWHHARGGSITAASELNNLGLDKSRANRLLEPFMWHTAIITATDWDNFFALRNHEAAQPEFQIIAGMLDAEMHRSTPLELERDEWHLPLVDLGSEWIEAKETKQWEHWAWVSAGRCARSSYDKIHDPETKAESYSRAEKLKGAGHMSPFEHQARPFSLAEMKWIAHTKWLLFADAPTNESAQLVNSIDYSGNFKYWHQFRKSFKHESNYAKLA